MFKSKASRTIGIIAAILVCIIVAVVLVEVFMQHPEELSYDEFFNKLKKGEIKSVYLEGNYKMNVLYSSHAQSPSAQSAHGWWPCSACLAWGRWSCCRPCSAGACARGCTRSPGSDWRLASRT